MTIPWNPDSSLTGLTWTPGGSTWTSYPSGWQCPVCLHVMAPFTSYCLFCPATTTTTTTTNINFAGDATDEVVKDLKDKIEREFGKQKRNAA